MTKIERIMAGCLAALSVASTLCTDAFAARYPTSDDWKATGRRITGAPSSVNSEPDLVCISQKKLASATMSGITHTTPGATSVTTIQCITYAMDLLGINNYSSATYILEPDNGTPNLDVDVQYYVYVSTNTQGDTVVSTGRIKKY